MSKLVLVHDYLLVLRGAERTFAVIADTWPKAPIATLLYDAAGTEGRFAGRELRTSPLQRLGLRQGSFRAALPLFGTATRHLDLDAASIVLSSSSAFAHGVRKPPGARHVCYCHSPFRYAWHAESVALAEVPPAMRPALKLILRRHRGFDRRAARDVDQYVANGEITRERIRRFWGRDSVIVHPPVEVQRFFVGEPADYALFVGELVRHKRPQLAIEAAVAAGRPIKVVGTGPERANLEARYRGRAEFLGRVGDAELPRLYAEAAALVVPGVEEFGIAAVEAQAAGRPVVGVDAGGLRETVVPGETGLLVPDGDGAALTRALREDLTGFDSRAIRAHAQRFRPDAFQARLREIVAS
jgi:glycosyltransferase involved in cell wall biosynthesis